MTVKQISVFLENRPGGLAEFTKVLSENNIDMRAMCIAETPDFGILRIIVDDVYHTICTMKEAGYVCSVTKVLAVEIPDKPGSLLRTVSVLGENDINLEYSYAFTTRKKDVAYMILRVNDNERAIEVLTENGITLVDQDEISKL